MPRVDTSYGPLRAGHRLDVVAALAGYFEAIRADVAARYDAGARRLIAASWDEVLAALWLERNTPLANDIAERVAQAFDVADYDPGVMTGWLEANAGIAGPNVNAYTEQLIRDADPENDPTGHVLGIMATTGAVGLATSMVATVGNFAARDTGRAVGAVMKTWQTNSRKSRASHARMNGQTVGIDAVFTNGMQWPGDPDGGAAEVADCKCSLTIAG